MRPRHLIVLAALVAGCNGTTNAAGGDLAVFADMAAGGDLQSSDAAGGTASASLSTIGASPAMAISDGTQTSTITVTVLDSAGSPLAGQTVVVTATGTGNTLTQPSAATDAQGVATAKIASTVPEAKILSATAGGVAIAQTAMVTFVAPVTVTQLKFGTQPTGTPTAARLQPVTIKLADAGGTLVPASGTAITVVLGGGTAGAVLGGTLTAMTSGGIATFADLTVDKAGTAYTLGATSTGLTADTSATFDVGVARAAIDGIGHLDGTTMNLTRTRENDGPSAASLSTPSAVALDATGHRLFVADQDNGRVLVYNLSASNDFGGVSHAAANVLGQADFRSVGGTAAQNTVPDPEGLAFDGGNNRLFVADRANHRVLVFNTTTITNGMNAAIVLGQSTFTGAAAATTQNGLNHPIGLSYDGAGKRLFVADSGNHRVIVYNVDPGAIASGAAATHEFGHAAGGTAFTDGSTASPPTRTSLNTPSGVAYDGGNRIFVSDLLNARVMAFDVSAIVDGDQAVNELGQTCDATCTTGGGTVYTQKVSALTQNGFSQPTGIVYDATGGLFVADPVNLRVLVFAAGTFTDGENATHVLGQADYTHNIVDADGKAGLSGPGGMAYGGGKLFVADGTGNRVMLWTTITDGGDASDGIGHAASGTMDFAAQNANDDPLAGALDQPNGLALDAVGHRLYVVDNLNNRVLVFPLSANNDFAGTNRAATIVLGQPSLTASSSSATATQSNLKSPTHVAVDNAHNRLFVVDSGSDRVLVYDTTALANGVNAVHVLGQMLFNARGPALSPGGMDLPYGVAYDAGNDRLFVSEKNNNRVTVFNTASIVDGMDAAHVLGQPDLMHNVLAFAGDRLNTPTGLAWDGAGGRLFVAEQTTRRRVLVFSAAPATIMDGMSAANVIGQSMFTSSVSTISQSTLCKPNGLAFDGTRNRLYVADECAGGTWVDAFDTSAVVDGMKAFDIFGEPDFVSKTAATMTPTGISRPIGVAIDGVHGNLFVADQGYNRVLVFGAR